MSTRPVILMCPPDYFNVEYVINPWMTGNIHRVDTSAARRQWVNFHTYLARYAHIELIEPHPGWPDMVFSANGALVLGHRCVPSNFVYPERRGESPLYRRWLADQGMELLELDHDTAFEGQGDALPDPARGLLWGGYGQRSSLEAFMELSTLWDVEIVPLRLTDARFYHLDTCFAPLENGTVMVYPGALDPDSMEEIHRRVPREQLITIDITDALRLACNVVEANGTLFMHAGSSSLLERLNVADYRVVIASVSEFVKAGGACKCLTLRLDLELPERVPVPRETMPVRMAMIQGGLNDQDNMSEAIYPSEEIIMRGA